MALKFYLSLLLKFAASRSLMEYFLMLAKLQNKNLFSRKAKKSTHLITGLSRYCHWFQKSLKKYFTSRQMNVSQPTRYYITINAFDTINLEILLKKLEAVGFSDKCIQWFRSCFYERIFVIEIENQLSDFSKVPCGVLQGSVLGPLLFLIYVNDMSLRL